MDSRVAVAAIRRLERGSSHTDQDLVAVEAPLEVVVGSVAGGPARSLGMLMRTPGDDRDLVLGLLHSEGLIHARDDVASVTLTTSADRADLADVVLGRGVDLEQTIDGRALIGTSACGLCGRLAIEGIDALRGRRVAADEVVWDAAMIASLPAALRARQTVFAETGGLHAAGFFDRDGQLVALREDVGRHNAVDKLVGATLEIGGLPAPHLLLVVSGRVAYEIVQKAVMAGVSAVVAVGAPSSLAVDASRATGLTLIGFARDSRFNVYTGHGRVQATAARTARGTPAP